MLATFIIGLREGLEAALIVSIVATFLNRQGRRDLLPKLWLGIGLAVALCVGVGVALNAVSGELPQRQQEGLETVVGAIAVVMVTYMVVWMRRHSRELKGQLETAAGAALASSRAGLALVGMAFLAVLREGFETAVFLLATFNNSTQPAQSAGGALLGIVVAVALGFGIYRGGVRLNLSRFFRVTGLLLVLVAAGLVMSALRTAHEAGWLEAGQSSTVDLRWLLEAGSVQSSLLTGLFGLQAQPTLIETLGWLAYLIPLGLYVTWPPGRPVPHRLIAAGGATLAAAAAAAVIALTATMPSQPNTPSTVTLPTNGQTLVISGLTDTPATQPGTGAPQMQVTLQRGAATTQWRLTRDRAGAHGADTTDVFRGTIELPQPATRPRALPLDAVIRANNGHLPLGARASTEAALIPVRYPTRAALRIGRDRATGRLVAASYTETTTTVASLSIGPTELAYTTTVRDTPTSRTLRDLRAQAADAQHRTDRRDLYQRWLRAAAAAAVIALVLVAVSARALRHARRPRPIHPAAHHPTSNAPTRSGAAR